MKPALHQYEDKLLEFAYGELPAHEAAAVEAHLPGCPRCSAALANIQAVRKTMGQLPSVAAPEAGLESLLAYADQAARRAAEGPPSRSRLWRWLLPLSAALATLTFGVFTWQQRETTDLSPAAAFVEERRAERDQKREAAPVAAAAPVRVPVQQGAQLEDRNDPALREEQAPVQQAQLEDRNDRPALREPPAPEADYRNARPEPRTKSDDALAKEVRKAKAPALAYSEAKRAPGDEEKSADPGAWGGAAANQMGEAQKSVAPKPSSTRRASKDTADDGAAAAAEADLGLRRAPEAPRVQVAQAAPKEEAAAAGAQKKGFTAGGEANAPAETDAPPAPASAPPPPAAAPTAPAAGGKGSLALGLSSGPQRGSAGGSQREPAAEDELAAASERGIDQLRADRDAEGAQRQRAAALEGTLDKAREAQGRGDPQGAVRLAVSVINQGAAGAQLLQALAQACEGYQALGDEDRAAPFCSRLVSEFPSSAAARSQSARALRARGKLEESRKAAPAAVEKAPAKPASKVPTY